MLHASLSAASGLQFEADGLCPVIRQACSLLNAANQAGEHGAKAAGDVCLGDVLADCVVNLSPSLEEARALLLVLGATREAIYERVLWRLAVDEASGMVRR